MKLNGLEAIFNELRLMQHGVCPACRAELPTPRPRQFTCNESCHRTWVDQVERRCGKITEITSGETGVTYLVPTRIILEVGITHADLSKYEMKRLDHTGLFQVGVPVDIGWGTATLHADMTVIRTCKDCGVSVQTTYDPETHQVAPAALVHRHDCRVLRGNDPQRS